MFDREEMEALARVVRRSNAVVIFDEVYEHLTFDGRPHISPLVAARHGKPRRARGLGRQDVLAHRLEDRLGDGRGGARRCRSPRRTSSLPSRRSPALQIGIAHALDHEMDFTLGLTQRLQANRDVLASGLQKLGFEILPCEGTYFLTRRHSRLDE